MKGCDADKAECGGRAGATVDRLVREGLSAKATSELSDDDKAEGAACAKALRLE